MAIPRRIVTGHRNGKAVFLTDDTPPRTYVGQKMIGVVNSFLWATPASPDIPAMGDADAVRSDTPFLPPPGETRLAFLVFPPSSVMLSDEFDARAAAAEFAANMPEMAATREADNPGMHRTDTIDYVIMLDGELYLELDDGAERLLKAQDMVVQNGTRHAWRNRSDRPATLAVVLIGATRRPGS